MTENVFIGLSPRKKAKKASKTRFLSEFTREFSKMWKKVEQHLEFWWRLDPLP
jgi:hypothetical protein